MIDPIRTLAPPTDTVRVRFALEPAFNCAHSLGMIAYSEENSGMSQWLTQTAARLSKDQAFNHQLLLRALYYVMDVSESWPSFPAYVDYLEGLDAVDLRDRALQQLTEPGAHMHYEEIERADAIRALSDLTYYLEYMARLYARKATEKTISFEPGLFVEAHRLLNDPPALKTFVVRHLRSMWHDYMADEWERNLPMLQESVEAYTALEHRYQGLTAMEAIRAVTGRDLSNVWGKEPFGSEMIFVPSAHYGPYLSFSLDTDRQLARVLFGARLPEGTRMRSAALSRSELLVRINALADENRLDILELLTSVEELCAQDIMQRLNLSQSATSRHLRQLVATGYVIERRRDVNKCYSLNLARLDDTFTALRRFLRID
jgi:ArsR family transcriptional regulator